MANRERLLDRVGRAAAWERRDSALFTEDQARAIRPAIVAGANAMSDAAPPRGLAATARRNFRPAAPKRRTSHDPPPRHPRRCPDPARLAQ